MMIQYSPQVPSLIKGTLLAYLHKTGCRVKAAHPSQNTLFDSNESLDADTFSLDALITQVLTIYAKDVSWLKKQAASPLYQRLFYALRHSTPQKYVIMEKALLEAYEKGLEYCLSNVSSSCRRLALLAREVHHEVHRMLGFIRFSALDEETLVARPKLYHDTADLILKRFAPRYPHYKVVLVLDTQALCFYQGKIFSLDARPFREFLAKKDDYSTLWEQYYKSQYIEDRKNIRLAQKVIPQKYWDWLQEGNILSEEKKKLT
ncbi:MAG: hypothetical protein JG781_1431 [Peptococcaceae bacterium]|nr:hypothetical protein [Peptococcaceae bacterium]